VFYAIGTNGGNQSLQRQAPTRDKADQLLNQRLNAPFSGDANDHLYQWDASRDYNPLSQIHKIKATMLAINSADDERNPPELNVMGNALAKIPNARLLLIPASDQRRGMAPQDKRNGGKTMWVLCCKQPHACRNATLSKAA
jgi:homoserine O-acetyltransferase/O-succinyltransferase